MSLAMEGLLAACLTLLSVSLQQLTRIHMYMMLIVKECLLNSSQKDAKVLLVYRQYQSVNIVVW